MKTNRIIMAPLVAAVLAAVTVTGLCGCGQTGRKGAAASAADTAVVIDSAVIVTVQYAKGFTVRYAADGVRLVDVSDPQKGSAAAGGKKGRHRHGGDSGKSPSGKSNRMSADSHFALVPCGKKVDVPEGYTPVEVPVKSVICMTLLQLSNFTALDAHDCVRGITGTKNLFDADILRRVEQGSIVKIGTEGNFDPEMVMAASPDVIFISPFKRGGYEAIRETGITLVPHLGYKELDPLGQAEWIKFVGMFIGREKQADEVFRGIEERYNGLKRIAAGVKKRPTVFSGEMHGGNWYAVGGRSYLAQLFRDAGADYIIKDDNTGGVNVEFEKMYAMAAEADYWRILNSYPGEFSYEALRASEPRNADFRAFRERHVIYCNMQRTPYYETTPVQPDVVLRDLLAIFHPELLDSMSRGEGNSAGSGNTFYTLLK